MVLYTNNIGNDTAVLVLVLHTVDARGQYRPGRQSIGLCYYIVGYTNNRRRTPY